MKKHYKNVETVWLICVALFYFLYNLPGVPEYGNSVSAIIHGAVTIGLIWVAIYVGLFAVYRAHPPRAKAKKTNAEGSER